MRWTPGVKRQLDHPKKTWRRSVDKEMKELGSTWGHIQTLATNRQTDRQTARAFFCYGLMYSKHEEG